MNTYINKNIYFVNIIRPTQLVQKNIKGVMGEVGIINKVSPGIKIKKINT
jgi:hypothetical protein